MKNKNLNNKNNINKINLHKHSLIQKFKYFIYCVLTIGNLNLTKKRKVSLFAVFSYCYNLLFLLSSLVAIIPIVTAFIYPNFYTSPEEKEAVSRINSILWFYTFVACWMYLVDWLLRLYISDLTYYYLKPNKARIKYFFKLSSSYQLYSVIVIIILSLVYGSIKPGYITWATDSNLIIAQVISILFLLNVIAIIPRFLENFSFGKNIQCFKTAIANKWKPICIALFFLLIFLIVFSYVVFYAEQEYYSKVPPEQLEGKNLFNTMWDALWYAFVTITTIGYGDYVPISTTGKIFAVLLSILGISFYTFIAGCMVSLYNEYKNIKTKMQVKIDDDYENQINYNKTKDMLLNDLINAGIIKDLPKNESLKDPDINIKNLDHYKIDDNNYLTFDGKKVTETVNFNIKNIYHKSQLMPIKNSVFQTLLIALRSLHLYQMKSRDNFSVLITNEIDHVNIKKIILVEKWPSKKAICELDIDSHFNINKGLAWEKFGIVSNFISKDQFDEYFKDKETISCFVVKKIIWDNKPRPLNQFNLSIKDDLNNIYFLEK